MHFNLNILWNAQTSQWVLKFHFFEFIFMDKYFKSKKIEYFIHCVMFDM